MNLLLFRAPNSKSIFVNKPAVNCRERLQATSLGDMLPKKTDVWNLFEPAPQPAGKTLKLNWPTVKPAGNT